MLHLTRCLTCLILFVAPAAALDVSLTGATSEEQGEALRGASLTAALDETATAADVLAAAQADYGRLVSTFYAQGYYGPQVRIQLDGREAGAIDPVSPPRRVGRVDITVTPGPLFRFGTTTIRPVAPGTELPPAFAPGEVAQVTVLQQTVAAGLAAWRAEGHAKAAVAAQTISANHPQRLLNAAIELDPGPQLRFGDLEVEGPTQVRETRIRAIAGLPKGEVYSPDELRRATTRLRRTGAFSSVVLQEAEFANPDGTLDFTAQTVDQAPRRFGVGGEIASLDGVSLSGFWMHRNFTGAADRLRFDAEIAGIGGTRGGVDYSLGARYTRPATPRADTDLFIEAEIAREDEEVFQQDLVRFEVGFVRYLKDEVELSFGIGVQAAETTDTFGTRDYVLFTLPLTATGDWRDDARDATDGYYLALTATPFVGVGDVGSGLQFTADARAYRTFGAARPLTVALRAQLGTLVGPSLAQAPSDFLFFSGGGGTVRGHSYQSLDVDLGGGQRIGGRSFLGLSAEARVKLNDTFGLVGFIDAGYIGRSSVPGASDGDWHSGAGVGLRYATGIGPIRLDLALPVTGPDDESGLQFYVGIGQAF